MILKHQHFDLLQKIVLERVIFKPPMAANASMHNEACFLFAVNGKSNLYSPNNKSSFGTNDGVVMKCGNYINHWHETEDDEPFEAVAVHFYPEILKLVYDDKIPEFLKNKPAEKPIFIERVTIDEMIKKYVDSLLFYFENPSIVNEELIILKVKEIILLLVNTDSSHKIRTILQDMFNPIEYGFKEIINNHLFENLSIEELAILTNLSVSSFKRKFKNTFKESPAKYIKLKKLEKAAGQLCIGKKRITDICYDCGFGDLTNFSKSFTSHFGCSPSEYRENKLS